MVPTFQISVFDPGTGSTIPQFKVLWQGANFAEMLIELGQAKRQWEVVQLTWTSEKAIHG